jgi:hypothetical protein
VAEALGRVAEALGRLTEPRWLLSWRPATPGEDREGVDFVVGTDVGPLYLQVTSSRAGARDFKSRRWPKMIACVRVTDGDMAPVVLGAIRRLRSKVLEMRGGAKP